MEATFKEVKVTLCTAPILSYSQAQEKPTVEIEVRK
jgi:hypothetical protein